MNQEIIKELTIAISDNQAGCRKPGINELLGSYISDIFYTCKSASDIEETAENALEIVRNLASVIQEEARKKLSIINQL